MTTVTEPTYLTADPHDHDLEWDPALQRPVRDLLADEGWTLDSQGPGTYVLTHGKVGACPMVVNTDRDEPAERVGNGDDVQWFVAIDGDGHSTYGENAVEYLPVSTPPETVAAFLRDYLLRHKQDPAVRRDAEAFARALVSATGSRESFDSDPGGWAAYIIDPALDGTDSDAHDVKARAAFAILADDAAWTTA